MPHKTFLYGTHAVLAALKNPKRVHKKLWLKEKNHFFFKEHLKKIPHEIVDDKKLDAILANVIHQGVILETRALPSLQLEDLLKDCPSECCFIVLDQVTDPQNLGAILRSCAAFNINGLIVPDAHSPQFEGTIAKIASGALEHVPVVRVTNLSRSLDVLKEAEFWCYGFAEQATDCLGNIKTAERCALVFGAEGEGLRRLTQETCDILIKVPTSSKFSTLNVAQTVSIAAFEIQKKILHSFDSKK